MTFITIKTKRVSSCDISGDKWVIVVKFLCTKKDIKIVFEEEMLL